MIAALLVGPGVVLLAFALLYATTLLDRLTRSSPFYGPDPRASVLAHSASVDGELIAPPATPTNHRA